MCVSVTLGWCDRRSPPHQDGLIGAIKDAAAGEQFVGVIRLRNPWCESARAEDDCGMMTAAGLRIGWDDLPLPVRLAVEDILGAQVIEARSQVGGFSPGTADRVVTAAGRRAFVKAASPGLNERTVELHRREAAVAAALPAEVPAPELRGVHDDGEWIALVFEDVGGRCPHTPWAPTEFAAALTALDQLAAVPVPATLRKLFPTSA
jgi:hypothetical protein